MPVYPEFGPESVMGDDAVSARGPEHSMGAEGLLRGDLQSRQHQGLADEERSLGFHNPRLYPLPWCL